MAGNAWRVELAEITSKGTVPQVSPHPEREFFIDSLLVRIHSIFEMILVDRLCAIGI